MMMMMVMMQFSERVLGILVVWLVVEELNVFVGRRKKKRKLIKQIKKKKKKKKKSKFSTTTSPFENPWLVAIVTTSSKAQALELFMIECFEIGRSFPDLTITTSGCLQIVIVKVTR